MKKLLSAFLVSTLLFVAIPVSVTAATPADTAVSWAVGIANNNRHGYSQDANVRWGNPDYDCSTLVISAWDKAGVPVKSKGASYTGNMYNAFINSGFKNVKSSVNFSTGSGLKKGDVLLRSGHTAMVSNVSGSTVTIVYASINEKGTITGGKPGDQTGKEILTNRYYNDRWTEVLRYGSGGTTNPTTSYFPRYYGSSGSLVDALNSMGITSSYSYRSSIARANGISNYTGTPDQNVRLLNLLKTGSLKRP